MDEIKKEQLKAIIISSVMTLLGVLFIVLKSEMLGVLHTIICFALLGFGVVEILMYCCLNSETKDFSKLLFGLIATFVAILLIFVNILFVIILGIVVAISGIAFIKTAVDDKKQNDKQWWVSLIIGILFLILGVSVAILYNVERIRNIIMIIFGVTLIFEGIMGFVFVLILNKLITLNLGKVLKRHKSDDENSKIDDGLLIEKEIEEIKEKTQKHEKNNQKTEEKSEKTTEIVQKPKKIYKEEIEEIDPDEGGFV